MNLHLAVEFSNCCLGQIIYPLWNGKKDCGEDFFFFFKLQLY